MAMAIVCIGTGGAGGSPGEGQTCTLINIKIHRHINIKKLIDGYTIETTPNVYEKYGSLKEYLNHSNNVYITYLPDEDSKRVINTAKKIIQEGLNAIPHLPARTINDYKMLEKYIGELSENAGCKKILDGPEVIEKEFNGPGCDGCQY